MADLLTLVPKLKAAILHSEYAIEGDDEVRAILAALLREGFEAGWHAREKYREVTDVLNWGFRTGEFHAFLTHRQQETEP